VAQVWDWPVLVLVEVEDAVVEVCDGYCGDDDDDDDDDKAEQPFDMMLPTERSSTHRWLRWTIY